MANKGKGKGKRREEERIKDPRAEKDGKSAGGRSKQKDYGAGFKSCNDVKWYSQNPLLFKDASSITYGEILGLNTKIDGLRYDDNGDPLNFTSQSVIPGIMRINYIPGVGVSHNENSNINIAARLVYTYIRHANSGSRNYEAPDYMTYLLGVANLQAFYAYMVRMYGMINYTSIQNRYVTKALVTASGGDYESLVKDMSSFRYFINYFGNKINSFAVPKDQFIYDRMTFLPLHIFTDGEDPKSQLYLFRPDGFYRWTGTKYETGSSLEWVPISENFTLNDLMEFGNNLLDAMMTNEDIGVMSGDTLRAYGPQGIRQVLPIEDKYITPILKDDGVLAQIHNMITLPEHTIDEPGTFDIVQLGGRLEYGIKVTLDGFALKSAYLDCWMKEPTPEFNMEATRLMTFVKLIDEDTSNCEVVTSGSEVVSSFDIYYFRDNGELTSFRDCSMPSSISHQHMDKISKFDWHPLMYTPDGDANLTQLRLLGDLQNYTIINDVTVDKLHNCAIQSLFDVYNLYLKTK